MFMPNSANLLRPWCQIQQMHSRGVAADERGSASKYVDAMLIVDATWLVLHRLVSVLHQRETCASGSQ